jgi:23S rRNA (adenine2503-C2)-methyltransferase|tara:strand:+ start:13536 stop:14726 length:1191 start_codon:yes stop_codon:yes gene_type:complete
MPELKPKPPLATTERLTEETVEVLKTNLMGLSPVQMKEYFESIGEKSFRATQLLKWIHQQGVSSFEEMTNLSKPLREKLEKLAEIKAPEVVSDHLSIDGTRKWVIRVKGGSCIEAVLIPEGGRGTLCVSSQVGCSLDCSFCSTGKQGFNRDLTSSEIIGQVWIAAKFFDSMGATQRRVITNVVMMGMGEPLMNFNNVVAAMQLMMDDNAYGLSKRRVTLSTAGVVPKLDKLADHVDVSLAISLHAAEDELRNELVPINRKYPIAKLMESAQAYIARMPDLRRKLTIEYTLIDQVNDRSEHAEKLAKLLADVPCKINLIPFNPFPLSDYQRSSGNAIKKFQDILIQSGFTATVRTTRGEDIDAACGQLAGAVNDLTRRSQRYRDRAESVLKVVEAPN